MKNSTSRLMNPWLKLGRRFKPISSSTTASAAIEDLTAEPHMRFVGYPSKTDGSAMNKQHALTSRS